MHTPSIHICTYRLAGVSDSVYFHRFIVAKWDPLKNLNGLSIIKYTCSVYAQMENEKNMEIRDNDKALKCKSIRVYNIIRIGT